MVNILTEIKKMARPLILTTMDIFIF